MPACATCRMLPDTPAGSSNGCVPDGWAQPATDFGAVAAAWQAKQHARGSDSAGGWGRAGRVAGHAGRDCGPDSGGAPVAVYPGGWTHCELVSIVWRSLTADVNKSASSGGWQEGRRLRHRHSAQQAGLGACEHALRLESLHQVSSHTLDLFSQVAGLSLLSPLPAGELCAVVTTAASHVGFCMLDCMCTPRSRPLSGSPGARSLFAASYRSCTLYRPADATAGPRSRPHSLPAA